MATKDLEERFKGIGLADSTAKWVAAYPIFDNIAISFSVLSASIEVAKRLTYINQFLTEVLHLTGLLLRTRNWHMSWKLSYKKQVCQTDVQSSKAPFYMIALLRWGQALLAVTASCIIQVVTNAQVAVEQLMKCSSSCAHCAVSRQCQGEPQTVHAGLHYDGQDSGMISKMPCKLKERKEKKRKDETMPFGID